MPIATITEDESRRQEAAALQNGFYWREVDGVRALVCAPLEAAGFTNAFSTRLGGVSPMPTDALNLAGFNDDTAANIHKNRRRFLKLFPGEWTLTGCWQKHGADVRAVQNLEEARQKPGVLGDEEYCDALISRTPKILLAIKTADCVPVLLCDPNTGAFAAIHAGWRGTVAAIVSGTVERLKVEYGARPEDLHAAIGPAANACCYEVGSEVIDRFKARFPPADHLFMPTRDGHARIDLQRANLDQLTTAGLLLERIHTAPLCTMCHTELFFSYRREKSIQGCVGRLMSVIGRR